MLALTVNPSIHSDHPRVPIDTTYVSLHHVPNRLNLRSSPKRGDSKGAAYGH